MLLTVTKKFLAIFKVLHEINSKIFLLCKTRKKNMKISILTKKTQDNKDDDGYVGHKRNRNE